MGKKGFDMSNALLGIVVAERRNESFVPEYQDKATSEECLGIAISHYFDWDGISIMKCFAESLTDANFHAERGIVDDMINKCIKGVKT